MFEAVFSASDIITTNISIVISLLIVILFVTNKVKKFNDVWGKQGLKGPKRNILFGNTFNIIFRSFLSIQEERYEKYGKIYGFYELSKAMISVAEPELIRLILVKDSDVFINRPETRAADPLLSKMLFSLRDEKWKQTRALMSPTFTSGKIKKMTTIINECITSLLENIESRIDLNEEIDAKKLFGAFSMDVIASCAFATRTNTHKNPDDPFVKSAKQFFNFKFWRMFVAFSLPLFLKKLINFNAIPPEAISFFKTITKRIIKERKQNKVVGNDFLQLLLDVEAKQSKDIFEVLKDINSEQMNNEDMEVLKKSACLLTTDDKNITLSEEEIVAQCLLFFIAGYETTAALLSYLSYNLAVNPQCQELLHEEVKRCIEPDGEVNYETINKMKYLNACVNESLRLQTPFMRLDREAKRDYKLEGTEIIIPKGAVVTIPVHNIHLDESYFSEAHKFKPNRFLPENANEIKPYTFLPFGSGPRNCIAMRFALMEAKLAICNVLLHYKFVRSENTDVPLQLKSSPMPMLPVKRVMFKCIKRNF